MGYYIEALSRGVGIWNERDIPLLRRRKWSMSTKDLAMGMNGCMERTQSVITAHGWILWWKMLQAGGICLTQSHSSSTGTDHMELLVHLKNVGMQKSSLLARSTDLCCYCIIGQPLCLILQPLLPSRAFLENSSVNFFYMNFQLWVFFWGSYLTHH